MSRFGFLSATEAIERSAIDALSLVPRERPAAIDGSWKGLPVTLQAASWSGPRVALFRTVRVTGDGIEIANLLGVAREPLLAPILGADFVSARPDAGVVVADLSPIDGPGHAHPGLPEWAQGVFSASPLIERVTPETAADALARAAALAREFISAVAHAPAATDVAQRRGALARYRDAHLADERMHTMLGHMFGADRASALMRDVLFPEAEEADVHA